MKKSINTITNCDKYTKLYIYQYMSKDAVFMSYKKDVVNSVSNSGCMFYLSILYIYIELILKKLISGFT